MNHAVPWDLNALWELAGRATVAGACRSPGVTAGFGPGFWHVTSDVDAWAGTWLALYGRGPIDGAGMAEALSAVIEHGREAAAFVHPRIFPQVLPLIDGQPVRRGGPVPMMARIGPPAAELRRSSPGQVERLGLTADATAALDVVADAFEMEPVLARVALACAHVHPEIRIHVMGDIQVQAVCISHRDGDTSYIDLMAVAKAMQRRGAGRAVLCAAMDDAAAEGVTTFFLLSSAAGQPLYRALGFDMIDAAEFWMINGPPEP